MSFLGRFLGGGKSGAIAEAMALLEEERFAEAADRLRKVAGGRTQSASGSLVSFHLRQALVGEGRRLLRGGESGAAVSYFAEAVEHWNLYPDLHCLLGTAQGMSGDWDTALRTARGALRLNPDYVEARLLEAAALMALRRPREAAQSLNDLLEAGRRTDHWLIARIGETGEITAENLPDDLLEMLEQAVSGRSEKEEVAAAVAQCRAGNWEEGLDRFAALVSRRPRYPDYRTRHAAAFFQLGRNDEALAEIEAALALNENYGTAIDLKGLILADQRRIVEAREFLAESDRRRKGQESRSDNGDLFGAYLRAVLALLTGEPSAVAGLVGEGTELVRSFARAELLRAAADDLLDCETRCGDRIAALAAEWPNEGDYSYLMACHHLRRRRARDITEVLGRWPAHGDDDPRPLYLEQSLALLQGREVAVADAPPEDSWVQGPAWRFLAARAALRGGQPAACWEVCRDLLEEGFATEDVVGTMTRAAAERIRGGEEFEPAGWTPPPVIPDSAIPAVVHLAYCRGDAATADGITARRRAVHPESLVGTWLSPDFWLDPIRTWIG